jgi:acetylornithine deacetylase/succinyl-diaminopimelate desuccinylase-like protein
VRLNELLIQVTSLNITVMRAGLTAGDNEDVLNVIPDTAEVKMDIRINPNTEPNEIKEQLDMWCQEVNVQTPNLPAGGGVTWSYLKNNNLQVILAILYFCR